MQRAQTRDDRWTAERWLDENARKFREDPTLPREEMEIDQRTMDLLFEVALRVGMARAERRPLGRHYTGDEEGGQDGGVVAKTQKADVITACEHCDLAGIRAALEAGADLTATNASHATPLMIAAGTGNLAAVRLLLDAGAEVDAAGAEGATAFLRAVGSGQVPVARLLVERGADPTRRTARGVGAVLAAASSVAMLAYVVGELGMDPNETSDGMTALGCAAGVGRTAEVRWLLEHGADPELPTFWDRSPLWAAVFRGHAPAARLLLERGASPAGRDKFGGSLLRRAVESGKADVVALVLGCHVRGLIDEGPDVALAYALERGCLPMIRTLVERHGASPGARDPQGRTMLMLAAAAGRIHVVQYLVEAGADPSATDSSGRTALAYVEEAPPSDWENAYERWQHTDACEIGEYLKDRLAPAAGGGRPS